MDHEQARTLIRRHFESSLSQAEWGPLRQHVRGCSDCKQAYDRAADLETLMSGDERLSQARLQRLAELGAPELATRVVRGPWMRAARVLSPILVAAAALFAVTALRPTGEAPGSLVARGGANLSPDAWITPYAKGADGEVRRLQDELRGGDALLFAYSNLAGSPYQHLVIVGRDASGRAHWYHPAWQDPDALPQPLPIEAGQVDLELPEAVRAAHAEGPLEICGLFLTDPRSVVELDRSIERDGWPDDARLDCHTVQVRR